MTFDIEKSREKLRSFVSYAEGEAIREKLNDYARETYKPQFPDQYLTFMNDHLCDFTRNHPQSQNHPFVLTLFTAASQHVMGDCVEECLDKAIILIKIYKGVYR